MVCDAELAVLKDEFAVLQDEFVMLREGMRGDE